MPAAIPTIAFVTGKLAEPALRRTLAESAPVAGFEPVVCVLPITVAALLTTDWVARHLPPLPGVQRIVLPGFCRGELAAVSERTGLPVERGPQDLRDLPQHFGQRRARPSDYGQYDLQIIAEINHAPRLSSSELLALAQRYRSHRADVIDVGCEPGHVWAGVGDAVRSLRDVGLRVSIDSLNPTEIAAAAKAGAELVLSVNATNRDAAGDWGIEVVAIPDVPAEAQGLEPTLERLDQLGVSYRIDPILEPIGFGFARSLGRYVQLRERYPAAEFMMGVGNLTELTDADSAGINVLLAGFCQELGIRSVLTTEVVGWARSSVRELDLARRLMHHAVGQGVLPKRLEPNLILLRDPVRRTMGQARLDELARQVTDPNYRLFAEAGELHIINGSMYLRGSDPYALFAELQRRDPEIEPSHAFYLGYELAKAVTALTLDKEYAQDRALAWGFLTWPERTHRSTVDGMRTDDPEPKERHAD